MKIFSNDRQKQRKFEYSNEKQHNESTKENHVVNSTRQSKDYNRQNK